MVEKGIRDLKLIGTTIHKTALDTTHQCVLQNYSLFILIILHALIHITTLHST